MSAEPILVLVRVAELLDALAIPYVVGGSVASGFHGAPRMTQDIDILIDLPSQKVEPLTASMRPEFYVDLEAAREAQRKRGSFNAIHLGYHHKVDFFIAADDVLDREQLDRRVSATIAPDVPRKIFLTSAENIVLRKLDWFRRGDEASEVQWRDILALLKIRRGALDLDYVRRIARSTGLESLLARALSQAEPRG
ncbi:MAG TPA: hypothetical protein VLD39_15605 [Gammaproteobacteria bacterium]|nr:hypothetical protein [Gammaproteobacteria bacterium]